MKSLPGFLIPGRTTKRPGFFIARFRCYNGEGPLVQPERGPLDSSLKIPQKEPSTLLPTPPLTANWHSSAMDFNLVHLLQRSGSSLLHYIIRQLSGGNSQNHLRKRFATMFLLTLLHRPSSPEQITLLFSLSRELQENVCFSSRLSLDFSQHEYLPF